MDRCSNDLERASDGNQSSCQALADALRGIVSAQYELAKQLQEQGEIDLACGWFKKAAMQGNVESAYHVGILCLQEYSAPQEAAYWFNMAAVAGHAKAQYYLADLYENGHGVNLDPETALYWHRQAASRGEKSSQAKLQSISSWLDF